MKKKDARGEKWLLKYYKRKNVFFEVIGNRSTEY
jgi:hypothetical protein